MRKYLKKAGLNCSIQLFSALRKEGLDELAGVMGNWYEYSLEDNKQQIEDVLSVSDEATDEVLKPITTEQTERKETK